MTRNLTARDLYSWWLGNKKNSILWEIKIWEGGDLLDINYVFTLKCIFCEEWEMMHYVKVWKKIVGHMWC